MAKVARNPMKMINLIVYIQIDRLEKAFLRFYRAVFNVKSQKMLLVSATIIVANNALKSKYVQF